MIANGSRPEGGNVRVPIAIGGLLLSIAAFGSNSMPTMAKEKSDRVLGAMIDEANATLAADRDTATEAMSRMLDRIELAFPSETHQPPNSELRQLLSHDKVRQHILASVYRDIAFPGDFLDGDFAVACLRFAKVYKALGKPEDLARIPVTLDHYAFGANGFFNDETKLESDKKKVTNALMSMTRTLVNRGADPRQAHGALGAMTFAKAIAERPGYRPQDWQKRLARNLADHDFSRVCIRYLLEQYPVPIPLPVPIDQESTENPVVMISQYIVGRYDSIGSRRLHQIAALNLAGRTRSVYFQPAIREALEKTEDNEVRTAARRALVACSRPVKATEPQSDKNLELDLATVDGLLEKVERSEAADRDYARLQKLVGLDYSNDRDRWLIWQEKDMYGRTMAGEQPRSYIVQGNVVDATGHPVEGATIAASPSNSFSKFKYGGPISGWSDSDLSGRFEVRFGMHHDTKEGIGIVPVVYHAKKKGFALKSFSVTPRRYLSAIDIADDSVLQIGENELQRPGIPLEIDFVMVPGVVLSATVEDQQGKPVEAKYVSLRWTDVESVEPYPFGYCNCDGEYSACSRLMPWGKVDIKERSTRFSKHRDNSFSLPAMWAGIPREFIVTIEHTVDTTTTVSDKITFDEPGRYRVRLITGEPNEALQVVVAKEAQF